MKYIKSTLGLSIVNWVVFTVHVLLWNGFFDIIIDKISVKIQSVIVIIIFIYLFLSGPIAIRNMIILFKKANNKNEESTIVQISVLLNGIYIFVYIYIIYSLSQIWNGMMGI